MTDFITKHSYETENLFIFNVFIKAKIPRKYHMLLLLYADNLCEGVCGYTLRARLKILPLCGVLVLSGFCASDNFLVNAVTQPHEMEFLVPFLAQM